MLRTLSLLTLSLLLVTGGCKNKEKSASKEGGQMPTAKKVETAPAPTEEVAKDLEVPEEEKDSWSDNKGGLGENGTMGSTKSYQPKIPDDLFFGMYTSPCFGQCPVYNIDIKLDGSAVLEGKKFFDYEGFYTAKFSEPTMQRIMAAANENGYYQFDNVYDAGVTDVPSILTILRTDQGVHWVYDRMNAPQALKTFEQEVETIIKDQQWKPMGDVGSPE